MKYFLYTIGFVISLSIVAEIANADVKCHHCNFNDEVNTPNASIADSAIYDAAAIAASAGLAQFDMGTSETQLAGSWSNIEGRNAFTGHLAKRFDDMLISGYLGCSTSGEVCGGGASITVRLK